MKEDADIQSFSQFLSSRNMFTIIRKNHRESGCRISANPSRYIQIIPGSFQQIAIITAFKAMQPSGIILREFFRPTICRNMGMNMEMLRCYLQIAHHCFFLAGMIIFGIQMNMNIISYQNRQIIIRNTNHPSGNQSMYGSIL